MIPQRFGYRDALRTLAAGLLLVVAAAGCGAARTSQRTVLAAARQTIGARTARVVWTMSQKRAIGTVDLRSGDARFTLLSNGGTAEYDAVLHGSAGFIRLTGESAWTRVSRSRFSVYRAIAAMPLLCATAHDVREVEPEATEVGRAYDVAVSIAAAARAAPAVRCPVVSSDLAAATPPAGRTTCVVGNDGSLTTVGRGVSAVSYHRFRGRAVVLPARLPH